MQHKTNMGLTEWALLILLGVIWGGSFLFARIAVLEVPPMTLVLLRVAIAALALNIWLIATSASEIEHKRRLWLNFAGMGILNNIIPFALIFYGQKEIGAGLAAIVNAMTPIWTLLIAHQFTEDERLSANKLIGIAMGFLGVAILIGGPALAGLSASMIAQLAVLGATISYGFAGVFGKRFAGIPPVETARGQLTASTLIMLPVAAFSDQFWTLPFPSAAAVWSIILLALLCTAFAYILFFAILTRAGAVNLSLVTLIVPVSAIISGALVLGETLSAQQVFGTLIILGGLVVIDGRLFSHFKKS